ncbi:MAG: hypothetical protein LBB08_01370, partial [Rickettsiales bacterium]|nr:hypothetical protein [Rickettsiales bacterium]
MIDEKLMERIELAITGSKKINEGYHAACTEYSIQLGPISSMISAKERRVLNISETDIRGQIKECAYFIEVHDKKELNLKEIG